MSNRTDYFIGRRDIMSLPAASAIVYLDGMLCPHLEPVEIIRAGWPEFGSATLRFKLANQAGQIIPVEQIEQLVGFGKIVSIRVMYDTGTPSSRLTDYPIFVGQIEGNDSKISSSSMIVTLLAKDCAAALRQRTVYGRRIENNQLGGVLIEGLDTIFNPDGLDNASQEPAEYAGRKYRIFSQADGYGRVFSRADAIYYLLCEYVSEAMMVIPPLERLRTLTEGSIIRNLDVTGLDVIEALYRCCEGTSLEFIFEPACDGTEKYAIVFFKHAPARKIRLTSQKRGDIISISKTSAVQINSEKSNRTVTNHYIAFGQYKRYESTYNLLKGWDSNLEDDDYNLFCISSNPEFVHVRNVYRCWTLNETGWYSSEPYNRGEPFDFSRIFEGDDYAVKPRRFLPCLSSDKLGESLGYFLEVSCDGGTAWHQYQGRFDVLENQCAIRFSDDRLDEDIFAAAVADLLRVRITATVEGDQKVTASCADGSLESACPVSEHIVNLPGKYKYNLVCPTSIFYGTEAAKAGFADDTHQLYADLRLVANRKKLLVETMEIKTPYLEIGHQVGDNIEASFDGRDILGLRNESAGLARIRQVTMDFVNQFTRIIIDKVKNAAM
jgi:hypothetical protein